MPPRRRIRLSLPEEIAERVPERLLDLRPYSAEGVAGIRRYHADLAAWIGSELGDGTARLNQGQDLAAAVMAELGVDHADWYRVLLGGCTPCSALS